MDWEFDEKTGRGIYNNVDAALLRAAVDATPAGRDFDGVLRVYDALKKAREVGYTDGYEKGWMDKHEDDANEEPPTLSVGDRVVCIDKEEPDLCGLRGYVTHVDEMGFVTTVLLDNVPKDYATSTVGFCANQLERINEADVDDLPILKEAEEALYGAGMSAYVRKP